MIPDLHHMFLGLTRTKSTRIVTMATAEVHPIAFETKQQQSKATFFTVTDEPHSSPKGGNNDVTNQYQGTVNKDEASDKKRKAIKATSPTSASQRMKGNGLTCGATNPAMIDDSTSVTNPNKHMPANNRIEDWLEDDAAADQGVICTGSAALSPKLLRIRAFMWKWYLARTTRPCATSSSTDTSTEYSKSTPRKQDPSSSENKV
jgi:hypothetical protein